MSNNKQTFNHNPNQSSVDWIIGEILKHEMTFFGTSSIPLYIIEQAKAMHRIEILKARQNGLDNGFSNGNWDSQLYYTEEFGGNND